MKTHLSLLIEGLLAQNFTVSVASPQKDLTVPPHVNNFNWELPGKPSLRGIQSIPGLAQLIKQHNYNLIHTHGYAAGVFGRLAAIAAGRTALVHTVHNFLPALSPCWVYGGKLAEVWLSRYTNKIITVSDELAKSLLKTGIPPDKLVTIYNGIDAAKFEGTDRGKARLLLGLAPWERAVGTVARLIPAKGIDIFLRALSLVGKSVPVRGFVIGDGPQRCQLQILADNLGLKGRVSFLGHRKDIPALLPGLDVFVLPSRQEGFGLSLLEAQWQGLPVIASDTGGLKEIINHGENGLLFTPGNIKELAARIEDLLFNEAYQEIIARKGQERARNRFSAEKMIKATVQVYRDSLTNTKERAFLRTK